MVKVTKDGITHGVSAMSQNLTCGVTYCAKEFWLQPFYYTLGRNTRLVDNNEDTPIDCMACLAAEITNTE